MPPRSRLSDRVVPSIPAWLTPAAFVAALFGLVCWLVPVQIVRGLVRAGVVPSPEDVEEGFDRLARAVDAIALIGKVETMGAVLAIGGVLAVVLLWMHGLRMQPQRVIHEHVDREEEPRRAPKVDPTDPLVGAVFVEDEDGEELIVPRRQQRRPSTSERYRTRGYARIRRKRP